MNNWHWTETDALPWCRARLGELLGDLQLCGAAGAAAGAPAARTTGLKSLGGEAVVNNRKGKAIALYELDVAVSWEGTGPAGELASGEIKLPYVSEENHDEHPELLVTLADDKAPAGAAVKAAILRDGKQASGTAAAAKPDGTRAARRQRPGLRRVERKAGRRLGR